MVRFSSLINQIEGISDSELPGKDAHIEMSPYRKRIIKESIIPDNARLGATLLLLHPGEMGEVLFTLIKRPSYDGHHSGQVSFPGGKLELNESAMQAAVRETEEEVGVIQSEIKVIQQLTELYIPPSNFLITPFIGHVETPPIYTPDQREVDFIFNSSLNDLLVTENLRTTKIPVGKDQFMLETPYFHLNDQIVWGATACVLNEFKHLVTTLKF